MKKSITQQNREKHARYVAKNLEKVQAYQKKWFQDHVEEKREWERRRLRELRVEVIRHYGGKCAFCGDANINHLSIDHMNNDGAKHRKEKGFNNSRKIYTWLRKNNYPDGFQVLCHTHNLEKGFYKTMTDADFNG